MFWAKPQFRLAVCTGTILRPPSPVWMVSSVDAYSLPWSWRKEMVQRGHSSLAKLGMISYVALVCFSYHDMSWSWKFYPSASRTRGALPFFGLLDPSWWCEFRWYVAGSGWPKVRKGLCACIERLLTLGIRSLDLWIKIFVWNNKSCRIQEVSRFKCDKEQPNQDFLLKVFTPHLWNPIGKHYIFIWKPWHGEMMRNAGHLGMGQTKAKGTWKPRILPTFFVILLCEAWPNCLIRTHTLWLHSRQWISADRPAAGDLSPARTAQNMIFFGLDVSHHWSQLGV